MVVLELIVKKDGNGVEKIRVKDVTVVAAFNKLEERYKSIYNVSVSWAFLYMVIALGGSGYLALLGDSGRSSISFIVGVFSWLAAIAFVLVLFYNNNKELV